MNMPSTFAWLIDEASATPAADRFLSELGSRLIADGLPLAGGALTLSAPHPIIRHRTWLWTARTGAVIEALASSISQAMVEGIFMRGSCGGQRHLSLRNRHEDQFS